MTIAPRHSSSPFSSWCNSPLTFSLLLREQREANKQQTVPSSPSLSPLLARRLNHVGGSTVAGHILPAITGSSRFSTRYSPAPALVPDNTASDSPIQRQALAAVGCKRQRGVSSPCGNSLATPSPIATNSKRCCRYSSGVREARSSDENHVVILSRTKPSHTRTTKSKLSQEQVVPSCGDSSPCKSSYGGEEKINQRRDTSTSKSGIKLLELFAGDDIFASRED